jgi:hypothetical protein
MDEARVTSEIDELFRELDQLLKNGEVTTVLAEKGINISLALVAADGLRAYLRGDKAQAAEDLATAAEEIRSRLALSRDASKTRLS